MQQEGIIRKEMRAGIVAALQNDILKLEGFRTVHRSGMDTGLGPINQAFPHATFPVGAVHEFLSASPEDTASTIGFVSGILSSLMNSSGSVLWISSSRNVFPPALKAFGVPPDRVIFINPRTEKEVLWAVEEALKCNVLTSVVAEVKAISFMESRRLQLAVEQSRVTGFVLLNSPRKPGTTACVSRWRITSLPSEPLEDLPGIGYPAWRVEILRIRNGKTGVWHVKWVDGHFVTSHSGEGVLKERALTFFSSGINRNAG